MARSSFFSDLLSTIAVRGRSFVDLGRKQGPSADDVAELCHLLLTSKGEASGIALACEILSRYEELPEDEKGAFFDTLEAEFAAPQKEAQDAARRYLDDPTPERLIRLSEAAEPVRLELLRRLNQAPGATLSLVNMRADLLSRLRTAPHLRRVDHDFIHIFESWFNRGFLELRRIDWQTPASILEKIIRYEAVHSLAGWDELRARIDPPDRHLYGFFHPRLRDEPLIFVEVALGDRIPQSIDDILAEGRDQVDPAAATTAIFYSISNCQDGLRGIPLGSFLIKQVVEDLRQRFAGLRTFATLSPVPAFADWLRSRGAIAPDGDNALRDLVQELDSGNWWEDDKASRRLERDVVPLAAHFLVTARDDKSRIIDPVARFHLGNGARLERLNWRGDHGSEAMRQSFGVMVNYLYDLDEIERNHEQFATSGLVNTAQSVKRSAKAGGTVVSALPVAQDANEEVAGVQAD